MKRSAKDSLQPFPNLQWTRTLGAEDYFDRADQLRARFVKLATITVLLVLVTPILAVWVIRQASAPNPVRVYADGRVFSGPLTTDLKVDDEDAFRQMRETVEVLLTRTEKGGVKALEDFVGPGVLELVEASYTPSKTIKSGFAQSYSITSSRILVAGPTWVVLGVRGLLSSRTLTGYQPSELFLVVGFSPSGKKTPRNPLGWRLVKLLPDPNGEMYYNQEIAKERAQRLGLDKN
jgi:hypothetical protein